MVNHNQKKTNVSVETTDSRPEKLDDLFLFSLSSVSWFFVIIQYMISSVAFLFLLPLITLGIIIPLYVGFFRGALRNSNIYRIKGWIHFFVGLGMYFIFTVTVALSFWLNLKDMQILFVIYLLAFGVFLVAERLMLHKIQNYYRCKEKEIQAMRKRVESFSFFGSIIIFYLSFSLGFELWQLPYISSWIIGLRWLVYVCVVVILAILLIVFTKIYYDDP